MISWKFSWLDTIYFSKKIKCWKISSFPSKTEPSRSRSCFLQFVEFLQKPVFYFFSLHSRQNKNSFFVRNEMKKFAWLQIFCCCCLAMFAPSVQQLATPLTIFQIGSLLFNPGLSWNATQQFDSPPSEQQMLLLLLFNVVVAAVVAVVAAVLQQEICNLESFFKNKPFLLFEFSRPSNESFNFCFSFFFAAQTLFCFWNFDLTEECTVSTKDTNKSRISLSPPFEQEEQQGKTLPEFHSLRCQGLAPN